MKHHTISIIILILLTVTLAYPQSWQWSNAAGNTGPDRGITVCIDQTGNSYVGGQIYSPYSYFKTDTLVINGLNDMFIAKYDGTGHELWVKQLGGPNNSLINIKYETINDLVYDSTGNCLYITGQFVEQCDFGITTLNSFIDDSQLFFGKFDLNGNCIWVKEIGGNGDDGIVDITNDNLGNIYLYASISNNGHIDTIATSNGGYIAKFDSTGNCIFAKKIYNNNTVFPFEPVAFSSLRFYNNELYAAGYNNHDTLMLDTIAITNPNYYGSILAKFDTNGNIEWAKQNGGPTGYFNVMDIDLTGNIYLAGSFFGNYATVANDTLHASGNTEMYFVKFDYNGNKLWLKQSNSSQAVQPYNINTDADGNSYITGYFNGNADFDTFNITASSTSDIFLARYNTLGDCLGVRHPGEGKGMGVISNSSGECYLTGGFKNTINFGLTTMTSYGAEDVFIAKIDAITGIGGGEERKANNGLVIYANPNAGKCNITIPDDFVNETNLVLSIYDNSGKLIQQKTLEMNDGNIKLNLEQEAKGVYNVVLSNKKKSYNGKIVFE